MQIISVGTRELTLGRGAAQSRLKVDRWALISWRKRSEPSWGKWNDSKKKRERVWRTGV